MKRPTQGRLNADDLELWRKVTDRTEKLDLKTLFTPEIEVAPPSVPVLKRAKSVVLGRPDPKPKPSAHSLMPSVADQVRRAPVQMDQRSFARMKRGKLKPEGRIDLHGMTLDRAHPVLTRFILSSQASGRRLVLVITGKGKVSRDNGPIPVPRGILRRNVPMWLAMPPLAQAVLQVEDAHISHGGGGAFYVYLRKAR